MKVQKVTLCRRLRDKGPDYRGFVRVSTSDMLGQIALSESQCHVETCIRSSSDPESLCAHVSSCLATGLAEATPVMLRHSAMNDLNIRPEIKQEVYHMAEQASGPLVQRVSRHQSCNEDLQRYWRNAL